MADINNQPNIPRRARGDEALGRPSQEKVNRGKGMSNELINKHDIKHEKNVPLSERPSMRARALVDDTKGGRAMTKEAMKLYETICNNTNTTNRGMREHIDAVCDLANIHGQKDRAANILLSIAKNPKMNEFIRMDAAYSLIEINCPAEACLFTAGNFSLSLAKRTDLIKEIKKLIDKDPEKFLADISDQLPQVAKSLLSLAEDKALDSSIRIGMAESLSLLEIENNNAKETTSLIDNSKRAWVSIGLDPNIDAKNRRDAIENLNGKQRAQVWLSLLQDLRHSTCKNRERYIELAKQYLMRFIEDNPTDHSQFLSDISPQKFQVAESLLSWAKDDSSISTKVHAANVLTQLIGQKDKAIQATSFIIKNKDIPLKYRMEVLSNFHTNTKEYDTAGEFCTIILCEEEVEKNVHLKIQEMLKECLTRSNGNLANFIHKKMLSIPERENIFNFLTKPEFLDILAGSYILLSQLAKSTKIHANSRLEACLKLPATEISHHLNTLELITKQIKRPKLEHLEQVEELIKLFTEQKDQASLEKAQAILETLQKQRVISQKTKAPISNDTKFECGKDYADYGFKSVSDKMGEAEPEKLIAYLKSNRPDNENIEEPDTLNLGNKSVEVNNGQPTSEAIGSKKISAGILLVEGDGRIWLRKVANNYGGYSYDFAKGTYEEKEGLTLQQTAIKELYEETGLEGKIEGFIQDQERGSSLTRYYLGRRAGGSPADFHFPNSEAAKNNKIIQETDHMCLVDGNTARELLKNNSNNHCQEVLENLVKQRIVIDNTATEGAPVSTGYPSLLSSHAKWPSLDNLEYISNLPGSTGPKLYRDKETGKKYVVKTGNSPEHARSEFTANQAYEAMGVNVPRAKLFETGNVDGMGKPPYIMLEYLEDSKTLGEWMQTASEEDKAAMKKEVQKGFGADALLGNWDICGHLENILIHNGKPYRIDTGGSLLFRAQGDRKTPISPISKAHTTSVENFSKYPMDFWSMRGIPVAMPQADGKVIFPDNQHAQELFGDIDIYTLSEQIQNLNNLKHVLMGHLPEKIEGIQYVDIKRIIGLRLYYMNELADQALAMRDDGWKAEYVDKMLMHRMGIRQNMIKKLLPKNLVQEGLDRYRVGEYEDPAFSTTSRQKSEYGGIRESATRDARHNYLKMYYKGEIPAGHQPMDAIISGPGHSSHSPFDISWKLFLESQMTDMVHTNFYWNDSHATIDQAEQVKNNYLNDQNISEENFNLTATIQHAYTQEMLRKIQFKFNDQKNKTVELMRTVRNLSEDDGNSTPITGKDEQEESVNLESNFNSTLKNQEIYLKTAVYESTSIFNTYAPVITPGQLLLIRSVPHHRILVPYFVKQWHVGDSPITEFVAMTHGIPVHTISATGPAAEELFKEHLGDTVNPPKYFAPKKPKDIEG